MAGCAPCDIGSMAASAGCRILYLVGELHTGGLERQLYYLLRAMDRERYRPGVAVWNYQQDHLHVEPIRSLGVPLYSFPTDLSSAAKLQSSADSSGALNRKWFMPAPSIRTSRRTSGRGELAQPRWAPSVATSSGARKSVARLSAG